MRDFGRNPSVTLAGCMQSMPHAWKYIAPDVKSQEKRDLRTMITSKLAERKKVQGPFLNFFANWYVFTIVPNLI